MLGACGCAPSRQDLLELALESRTAGRRVCPRFSVDHALCSPPSPPQSYEEQELLRLVYSGGVQPEIRKAVWPFLLGHYQFGMTETERKEVSYPHGQPKEPGSHAGPMWGRELGGAGSSRAVLSKTNTA